MARPTISGSPDGGAESCFLGVGNSFAGRRWLARPADDRTALALAQQLDLPEIVGRVLAARGVGTDEAAGFLDPRLRDLLPDPARFKDMDEACRRLVDAITGGESIAIFGDYDVDGATSAALLARFLAAVGGRSRIYIPDRLSEGYGPNEAALLGLAREGATLVVTVDCGISAHGPLAAAAAAGLDAIVVDHHAAGARLPPAVAVINPNRLDEDAGYRDLAAVGVAFLLVIGVNRALRRAGWYEGREEPDLTRWLDLVALGTVCDSVPLLGLNRALVAQGLKVMARRGNPGLAALADVAGIDRAPGTYHAGFILGPRINAGGRLGESGLAARLLSTDDGAEAGRLASRLDDLNRQRQTIEAQVLAEAMAGLEGDREAAPYEFVLAAGEGWHPGVIGIVASRLQETFARPVFVVSLDGETGTGSGRSVAGVDLGAAVIAAGQAGLLIKGGGHAMAAGFTVERRRLGELRRFLNQRLAAAIGEISPTPRLHVDGALKVGAATIGLTEALDMVAPYGAGNPEPIFAVAGARVAHAQGVGDNHLRLTLTDDGGGRLAAIAFRCMDRELGQRLLNHDGASFHIAGKLRPNTWKGRTTVQLQIEDAAPAW